MWERVTPPNLKNNYGQGGGRNGMGLEFHERDQHLGLSKISEILNNVGWS